MPTVVIAYNQFPDTSTEAEILSEVGAKIIHMGRLDTDESWQAAIAADALMVSVQNVPADLINRMDRCKIICRIGTGVDAIDIPAATARSIWVTNVPDYSIDEVATHAVGTMLMHARRLPRLMEMVRTGVWWDQTKLDPIRRLTDMTFGVLGYGRIGRAAAQKGKGLGMNIIAYDPYVSAETMAADGVRAVDFDTLLRQSDYLSLHSPATPETNGIINREALANMKPTAFLINAARGSLIDETALVEAVQSGKIAGAALDVLQKEPPAPDHPLMNDPRIWITPHAGWYSEESTRDVRVKGTQDVVRVLKGEAPRTPVNKL